jgi:hypothetical protein
MAGIDYRQAGHLPNNRPDGSAGPPEGLPRQRNGVTPEMRGRYPDYNVLDETRHWDEVTRRVVTARVEDVPSIKFFTATEAATLGAFCDRVMAQDREPKIPVLNMIDAKLFANSGEGYRFAELPDDSETWRQVALGLDAAAHQHGSSDFKDAAPEIQDMVIQAFCDGTLHGEVWDQLPPSRAWSVVMRDVLSAFYSHPWAWSEIGFGGPAYPRGYARMGIGQRESWEGAQAFERDPVKDTQARHVEGT